jgi:hypothetical protein
MPLEYSKQEFKIPIESRDYPDCSDFVVQALEAILQDAIRKGRNKITINTNLRLGLPMENINKIAGPFVEAWAYETFYDAIQNPIGGFELINVEARARLDIADITLQFRRPRGHQTGITVEVDTKATAEDIDSSGKSPNITSYARIRTAYVEDPDLIFIILSLKHRVYSTRNAATKLMDGTMEVVAHNTYDLKYISDRDLNHNPALGTGQLQITDIHYVSLEKRTTWEFCQLLDKKYLLSARNTVSSWHKMAKRFGWIKTDGK